MLIKDFLQRQYFTNNANPYGIMKNLTPSIYQ